MQHPRTTTFAHGPLLLVDDGRGLPRIFVQLGDWYLTIMSFSERSMASNDGIAEAWANARHVYAMLTAPAPAKKPEHVNAFDGSRAVIDAAVAGYEAGRR